MELLIAGLIATWTVEKGFGSRSSGSRGVGMAADRDAMAEYVEIRWRLLERRLSYQICRPNMLQSNNLPINN